MELSLGIQAEWGDLEWLDYWFVLDVGVGLDGGFEGVFGLGGLDEENTAFVGEVVASEDFWVFG